jgi:hypothetical protein
MASSLCSCYGYTKETRCWLTSLASVHDRAGSAPGFVSWSKSSFGMKQSTRQKICKELENNERLHHRERQHDAVQKADMLQAQVHNCMATSLPSFHLPHRLQSCSGNIIPKDENPTLSKLISPRQGDKRCAL